MISLIGFCVSISAATPDNAFSVSARIDAETLEVGQEYEIVLEWKVGESYSTGDGGIPAPILQIEVPRTVRLTGKVLEGYRELSKNEFLQEPFERLIKESPVRIGFKLRRLPPEDARMALNVLAYVGGKSDGAWFVRRRLEIPLRPGAEATEISPTNSNWGKGKGLQIGDKATPFTLPRADGSQVSLRQYLGKKNVIVTTYRAHW